MHATQTCDFFFFQMCANKTGSKKSFVSKFLLFFKLHCVFHPVVLAQNCQRQWWQRCLGPRFFNSGLGPQMFPVSVSALSWKKSNFECRPANLNRIFTFWHNYPYKKNIIHKNLITWLSLLSSSLSWTETTWKHSFEPWPPWLPLVQIISLANLSITVMISSSTWMLIPFLKSGSPTTPVDAVWEWIKQWLIIYLINIINNVHILIWYIKVGLTSDPKGYT